MWQNIVALRIRFVSVTSSANLVLMGTFLPRTYAPLQFLSDVKEKVSGVLLPLFHNLLLQVSSLDLLTSTGLCVVVLSPQFYGRRVHIVLLGVLLVNTLALTFVIVEQQALIHAEVE